MAYVREGELIGTGKRFGIVVSRFNENVTKQLLEGALNYLRRSGVSEANIDVAWVPGSFEIPLALKAFADTQKFHALLALGCIIRGETSNYEHIAQATTDQIAKMMVENTLPIGFGVLTVDSFEQAIQRAGGKYGNKGREAAESALEMANLIAQFEKSGTRESEKLLKTSIERWKQN